MADTNALIDQLNTAVTTAIMDAEAFAPGSDPARRAFATVASLEQALAALLRPDTIEGEAARLGAVAAYLSAGEPERAFRLADFYLLDVLEAPVLEALHRLRQQAGTAEGASPDGT